MDQWEKIRKLILVNWSAAQAMLHVVRSLYSRSSGNGLVDLQLSLPSAASTGRSC